MSGSQCSPAKGVGHMIFSENRGAWSKTVALGLAGLIGAATALVVTHRDFPARQADAHVDPTPVPSQEEGRLTLTAEQRARIQVELVQAVPFEGLLQAIGQIAYNDDLSTPVPSPYSGRVVRVIAKLGD